MLARSAAVRLSSATSDALRSGAARAIAGVRVAASRALTASSRNDGSELRSGRLSSALRAPARSPPRPCA